jgi:hypothetical protein
MANNLFDSKYTEWEVKDHGDGERGFWHDGDMIIRSPGLGPITESEVMSETEKADFEMAVQIACGHLALEEIQKVIDQRGLLVEKISRDCNLYEHEVDRKTYPDGSYDPVPKDHLSDMLKFKTWKILSDEEALRVEKYLGFKRGELVPHLKKEPPFEGGVSKKEFLFGHGLLDTDAKGHYVPNSAFRKLKRVRMYYKYVEDERKKVGKARASAVKKAKEAMQRKAAEKLARLKNFVKPKHDSYAR